MLKTAIKSTLIIDHEEVGNTKLQSIFAENGLLLNIISPQLEFLNMIEQKKYDCVMVTSDLLNNMTYKIIDEIKGNFPWIVVFVILKEPTFEKIFSFVRYGVDDFLLKPYTWEDIEKLLMHYYF